MNHRHHLLCLLAGISLAVLLIFTGSGGIALAGVSLALLICPVVMAAVMWLLMRETHPAPPHHDNATQREDAARTPR
jgi:hypothetical protein